MPRKPIVAGMFYEDSFDALDKQITECFLAKLGPGSLPSKRTDKEILGIVCPHAGYPYSGPCAAWAYKIIAESTFPDLFIILGTNHAGLGKNSIFLDDWETPLGIIKTDKTFAEKLIENSSLTDNEEPHLKEHSIEVQLPFLQFANKDKIKEIKIIAISCGEDTNYEELALSIKKTIEQTKKKVCLIASSDFTHYGINYGYIPFTGNIKENLYKLDKKAIKFICDLKPELFTDYLEETQATICGSKAIATLIQTCKLLNSNKGELLQYYTSGDIINDYSSAVGYASIVFKK